MTDRTIKRLQARIADGDEHLRGELAEVLMRAAQENALHEQFDVSLKRINEAITVVRQLVNEGQSELAPLVGRSLLFRAAVSRFHKGPEAGVTAFNDAIQHIVETGSDSDPELQDELATALMNKADILIDPLGAYSAALAAQGQAVKIWQHLVDHGHHEFRQALVSALQSYSDSKIQNGDPESAILDLKQAAEIAEEGMEADDQAIQPMFIQTLLKLARLYDQENDIDNALETLRSAVRTINRLIDNGIDKARMMFTTLYLHIGMLYEKRGDSAAALAEFDRCRDVFTEIFREQNWGASESYAFRTGLANVLMCRGNMLADLKRYAEAEQAFEDSVWQYQQAAEHRPPSDTDETLIPYSIGVVQLNHANLLVIQDRFEEAVDLKMQAITALKRRLEEGHDEIIPNFLTALRKLIDIRQMQGKLEHVFELMNQMIDVLEKVVDDGKLEHRLDLGLSYRQRSFQWDELRNFESALADSKRALRIFRAVADDERDFSDVHVAKIQWSELLHQIAVTKVKQGNADEAFDFLQREVADAERFYEEGNDFISVDLMLAYTQLIHFIEIFGKHKEELQYPTEKFIQRIHEVQACCTKGIELSRKRQAETGNNLMAKLFFMMKTAFFFKAEGALFGMLQDHESACQSFVTSIEHWHRLLGGLENLKAKDRYDAAERGETVPDGDVPGGVNDPYQDRYIFYINELRETMQLAAKAHLACGRQTEAEGMYEKENLLTRELAQNGVPNGDRFLVVSLTSHARSLEQCSPPGKTMQLYEETLQIMQKRFQGGDIVDEDFWVLRRVCKRYLDYLREKGFCDYACRTSEMITTLLESVKTYPPPHLWLEVCMVLEIQGTDGKSPEEMLKFFKRHRKLLKRHPEFKGDKELKKYDRTLKARSDESQQCNGATS